MFSLTTLFISSEVILKCFGKPQLNPQKEVPALDDDGFIIGESVAIMQYLCDQYAPESSIYPQDPKQRALVNHRLCFNMNYFYANISPYAVRFVFFFYSTIASQTISLPL